MDAVKWGVQVWGPTMGMVNSYSSAGKKGISQLIIKFIGKNSKPQKKKYYFLEKKTSYKKNLKKINFWKKIYFKYKKKYK